MTTSPVFSLTSRISFIFLILVAALEFLFSWYHVKTTEEFLIENFKEKGELISEQLADASSFYLLSGDSDSIKRLIIQTFNHDYVTFISINDDKGISVAQHSSSNFNSNNTQSYFYFKKTISNHDIYTSDIFEIEDLEPELQTIGSLILYTSKEQIAVQIENTIYQVTIISISVFFCLTLLIHYLARYLTYPIRQLINNLKNNENNPISQQLESSEVGILQSEFNKLTLSLNENRSKLDDRLKKSTLRLMDMVKELETNNDELNKSKNEADRANKTKSNFLANMSHEIRTPLNGIKGFISLLQKTNLNSEQKRHTNIIQKSCSDLITIVNEILDFSKIESGKVSINNQSFDLIDTIESVRDRLIPAAIDKHIDIYLCIYSDVPRTIYGDESRLKQVLLNLMNNAIKFTETGFVQAKVYLNENDQVPDKDNITFDILDTGIGINHADKSQIFKAFQQIETASNRRYSGTGLGLVIARNLVRLMGGNISLTDNKPEGSIFSFFIPLNSNKSQNLDTDISSPDSDTYYLISAQQESLSEIQSLFMRANLTTETALITNNAELEITFKSIKSALKYINNIVIDNRNFSAEYSELIAAKFSAQCKIIHLNYTETQASQNAYFLSLATHSKDLSLTLDQVFHNESNEKLVIKNHATTKTVLIVDDNKINLTVASELLKFWGHRSLQADNALDALALYKNHPIDLVLMDIQMPEHDGIEAMKMLRKTSNNIGTPIIALTANAMEEEEKKLKMLGFDGYISKPIDEDLLSSYININKVSISQDENIQSSPIQTSFDYKKTLELSGQNKELVSQLLTLLKKEIPNYIHDFKAAQDSQNLEGFKQIKHKLEGTTCYTSLPKLKLMLEQVSHHQVFEDDTINAIIAELKHIDTLIESKIDQT